MSVSFWKKHSRKPRPWQNWLVRIDGRSYHLAVSLEEHRPAAGRDLDRLRADQPHQQAAVIAELMRLADSPSIRPSAPKRPDRRDRRQQTAERLELAFASACAETGEPRAPIETVAASASVSTRTIRNWVRVTTGFKVVTGVVTRRVPTIQNPRGLDFVLPSEAGEMTEKS